METEEWNSYLEEFYIPTKQKKNHIFLLFLGWCLIFVEKCKSIKNDYPQTNDRICFYRAIKLFKTRVALLKRSGLLPEHYDPLEILASLEMPDHVLDCVEFSDNINNLTLAQVCLFT